MSKSGCCVAGVLATVLLTGALGNPGRADTDEFTLAAAIPNDVLMFINQRSNPDREFLNRYWGEVFEALGQSGVGDDVIELLGAALGMKQAEEIERLKERMQQLIDGVDWERLGGQEIAFAERLALPVHLSGDRPPVMMTNMVWLSRGCPEGAARNHKGLVAILEGIAAEINRAIGAEALEVEKSMRADAQVVSLNVLAAAPGAPVLPLAVVLRDDVLLIALGEHLYSDVLDLLDRSGSKPALGADPRFKAAFSKLPPAADSMMFFDMQALLQPIRTMIDTQVGMLGAPQDVYRNTGMRAELSALSAKALSAYQRGDVEKALALVERAYAADSKNSIVLYNLACFNALLGNSDEALTWLEQAVEGGFYAPRKIAGDSDLDSLHGQPRYEAALSKAGELAMLCCADDLIINGPKQGEAYRLIMQAWQTGQEQDYEQGLKLVKQAYAVAPEHSRVLYCLACFHALLGHESKALDFLDRAVEAGFYCPEHISRDPDLKALRSHERYHAATAQARKKAAELTLRQGGGNLALVKRVIDRIADAVGILDYFAMVESTDGYAVKRETLVALVAGAQTRPIYPVFGKRPQLTDFERYLPEETMSFSISGGLDIAELYKFIEDTFRVAGPQGEGLLAKWAEIQKQIGFDIQKDVLDWIDGDFVGVTLADGAGSVWMIKVTDEQVAREKVDAAIEFLSTTLSEKLAEFAAGNPALAMLGMFTVQTSPVEDGQLDGFESLYFTMAPQQPAIWGVADGQLIFGSSADAVSLCLATARGEHPNIRNNARAMSEAIIPDGPFASIVLTDWRNLGEDLAAGVGIGSMVCGMMGAAVPDPEARPVLGKISSILSKLAPVARKIDFFKSTSSCTTFDGQVWHSRGVTHYFSPAERAGDAAH